MMPTKAVNRVITYLRRVALTQGSCASDGDLLERYVTERDEAAFEGLMCRHGPMVFGVCRRILGNEADAEDAFQATFLVLVRKSRSIRPREMVGSWLHGVARNTALKARSLIHKRRCKEREVGMMPPPEPSAEIRERVEALVDGELARLPDKYRLPIVACDLEGKTIKEAAHQLGWPKGTVATQLRRGRVELAKRLSKSGKTLSGTALAAFLSEQVTSAGPPALLLQSTLKAASLFATGNSVIACAVSNSVATLTEGVLKTMVLSKLKTVGSFFLILGALALGSGVLIRAPAEAAPVADQANRFAEKAAALAQNAGERPQDLLSKDEQLPPVGKAGSPQNGPESPLDVPKSPGKRSEVAESKLFPPPQSPPKSPSGKERLVDEKLDLDRRLKLTFPDMEVSNAVVKLEIRAQGLLIAATIFSLEADGRVKLTDCAVARMGKGIDPAKPWRATTMRSEFVLLRLDQPVRNVADLCSRRVVTAELAGGVRVSFD
jgi:RNA polymerase sigma factor (sigma-70 family)